MLIAYMSFVVRQVQTINQAHNVPYFIKMVQQQVHIRINDWYTLNLMIESESISVMCVLQKYCHTFCR